MKSFTENTQINILSKTDEELVFDIKGLEPPLVNALRRILISEIPTMAIETVNIYQNTSVMPDEVLAHRLGLIPIFADAEDFQYKRGMSFLIRIHYYFLIMINIFFYISLYLIYFLYRL